MDTTLGLSGSFVLTSTVPLVGSRMPAASMALAKAMGYERSMPITSPVLFISGPSTASTPRNLLNGNTGTFTETWFGSHTA